MSQICPGLCQLLPLTVACSHRQGNQSTESGIGKLGHRMPLTIFPWGCVSLRGHINVEVDCCKLTLVPAFQPFPQSPPLCFALKSGSSSASSPVKLSAKQPPPPRSGFYQDIAPLSLSSGRQGPWELCELGQ